MIHAGILMGLVTGLFVGLLTGCGSKEKVDYSIEGVNDAVEEASQETAQAESSESSIGSSEVEQFSQETKWEEVWTIEENVDEAVEVTVDAKIVLPDADEMSVVKVKVPEFDAEYKERMLKSLFGSEKIYYADTEHIPEEDLEEKYTPAEAYDIDLYMGKRDGTMFQVFFYVNEPEEESLSITRGFLYAAKDFKDIRPKGYEGYTVYMEHPYVSSLESTGVTENACEISEAEAEKLVRAFAEELGLEFPVLAYTKPLLWGDDSMTEENAYDWPVNGYVFHYEYGVDNLSLSGYGKEEEYPTFTNWKLGETSQYSMENELTVYVTDRGIIQMNVSCPVETIGVTEGVKLLPLDTIKEIMIEQTKTRYEDFRFLHSVRNTELYFTHMELIYFRVRDKENAGQYSYVPAWRLSDQFGMKEIDNRSIRNPVIVNAIDGTWIDFFGET